MFKMLCIYGIELFKDLVRSVSKKYGLIFPGKKSVPALVASFALNGIEFIPNDNEICEKTHMQIICLNTMLQAC